MGARMASEWFAHRSIKTTECPRHGAYLFPRSQWIKNLAAYATFRGHLPGFLVLTGPIGPCYDGLRDARERWWGAVDADTSSVTPRDSKETTRRRMLTLMGAGGAAALATLVSSKDAQAGHDGTNVMHLAEVNSAPGGGRTDLKANTNDFALSIDNTDTGETSGGLYVTGQGGKPVIEADVLGGGEGVGVAVQGVSGGGETFGEGPATGVEGISGSGQGVHGHSESGEGGFFSTNSGFALATDGKSRFSTAGTAVLPAGANSVFVANSDVTADSHISVTLTDDPGQRTIRWVERDPGTGFTLHMTSAPPPHRRLTGFTYLIVEPE